MTSVASDPLFLSRYPATEAGLTAVLTDYDRLAETTRWTSTVSGSLRLVLEELICNIVDHGGQSPDQGWFAIRIVEAVGSIELVIDDAGVAFDPTQCPPPDTDASLEDRDPGGIGIHLIRSIAEAFRYQRAGDINQTTVVVKTVSQ